MRPDLCGLKQFSKLTDVSGLHGRGDAQRLMHSAEILGREPQGACGLPMLAAGHPLSRAVKLR